MNKRLSGIFCIVLLFSITNVQGEVSADFTDTAGHWAEPAIKWGAENTFIDGYADQTFQPDRTMTEAEFVALLLRSFREKTNRDSGPGWADPYYNAAQKYNMPLSGTEQSGKRDMPISRTRVAEIVSGADSKHYAGQEAIRYILQKGYAQGKISPEYSGLTVYSYRGEESLTRAEALTFIKGLQEQGWTMLGVRPSTPSDPMELGPLPGEKLKGSPASKGKSGPVLFSTYEIERGTVYFTNNQVSPTDPLYRVRLNEKYNPFINEQVYAIANSLYDPDQEKLSLSYSRKGNSAVSIKFGTYDMNLQSSGSPYFNSPFEYEVHEDLDHSQRETIELNIYRLWGNLKSAQMDDYYIRKLRSSLVSFLGENEGNWLCDTLVEEMKVLIQDQAQVKDWELRLGDPELDYGRSQSMSLAKMEVRIHTSISGIQVSFTAKTDPDEKPNHYVVTPDGKYVDEKGALASFNNLTLQIYMSIERKGGVIVRSEGDVVVKEEEILTPNGPAMLVERQFTYLDDPDKKLQTAYEVRLVRTEPGEPKTKINYVLLGMVTGNKESAKQDMLELIQGWVVPKENNSN